MATLVTDLAIVSAAGSRSPARLAGLHQHPIGRRWTDLQSQHPDDAVADLAVLHSGRAIDDDQYHAHHHRAVADASGARHPIDATDPGAGRSGLVPDLIRDGAGV